ncbi:hypothetical protein C8R43DRAFT_941356 [Mycena crocata]|nr:hypothetical protein C8R43DRAFT_941356 [Mycena crocata]
MPVHQNEVDFNTLGPPGSREGSGEVVHPSRECLLAASSEYEISRSQGTQGPIPGYHTSGPFCNGSAALAVTDQSEEQRVDTSPNIAPTEHLPHGREVVFDLETHEPRNIAEGIDQPSDVHMADVEVVNGRSNDDNTQANCSGRSGNP